MRKIVVAIDGPAGAGKSTIAKLVAGEIGYAYIDTGAMYRSVTWKWLQTGKEFSEEFISELANTMVIEFRPEANVNRVFVDGQEVTSAIRSAEVTANVSRVAAIGPVREAMVAQQRRMGDVGGVLMDGRDIGTVVLPNADVKIFLTADAESRAKRRVLDLEQRGQTADFATILQDIIQRDEQDRNRPVAPLRQAEDAVLLDTTHLNLEQSLQAMLSIIKEKIDL